MIDILGLPGIELVDLIVGNKRLTVVAEVSDAMSPLCDRCGKPMYRHGRRTNTFADTPLQMQPTKLEIIRTRYRCDVCKKMVVPELPFLDERRRTTKRLVDAIRERCLSTTFHDMAQQTGLAVNTIKNIALDMIANLENTVRFETPVVMGIDEIYLARGYRCVITNLATNTVFDMLEDRTQQRLKRYFQKLPDSDKVEWVCTDIWRPFKKSFSEFLPSARIVIDKYHVVEKASRVLDEERKKYQAQLSKNNRIFVKKSIRWLTLKRPANLTAAEQKALIEVRRAIPDLAYAYDFKENFYRIYDDPDKQSAMRTFEAWEKGLPAKGMDGFRTLAKTVRNHYEDIFAYWDSPNQITNVYTECLNGLIKIANRMGRGYSFEIIRAKTLYSKYARKVGSSVRIVEATGLPRTIEYGPHIPTLVDIAESGGLE
ncbi:MAG TPA: ISL3 family transposase [Nitrospirota bacterium]|nr:ISL3 family transposase [Nitrospirota bacterium]